MNPARVGEAAAEVEPPTRTVETWLFEGWPGAEAIESTELREAHGVTTLTQRLAFRDQAGRDHMNKTDGFEVSYDHVEDLLRSLLDPEGTVSGSMGPIPPIPPGWRRRDLPK